MKNKLKTLLALLLVAVMALSFVACGNSNTTDTTDTDNSSTNNSTTDASSTNNNETVQLDKFQQFENGLTDKQIEFEIVQKMGSMVGAKEGYGYKFNEAPRKILCKKESKQTKGLRSRHNEGFPLDNPFPERRLQYARLGVNTVVVFWEF